MCGIIGLLTPDARRADLAHSLDLLTHRGPDDAGVYTDDGIALGARRLSIIDLADGHQPLANEDETVWIAHNGEVVNAPALRRELEAAGHRFRTQTDTEAIVHAYEEWGCGAGNRLRGMFAFALWDAPRRRLLLARDRFGIKPLYYARHGDRLAFASEISPLFALLPDLPRRANLDALGQLFQYGFIPSPLTAFAGVHKLPAAHMLAVEGRREKQECYWSLQFPPAGEHRRITPEVAAEEFRAQLAETMDAWRLSDVPVGSLLSGGIDSATLAAELTRLTGRSIHTFSIGFEAASHDESDAARRTAQCLDSVHHETKFAATAFDLLPNVVARLEEPQCSATSVPIYLLYELCRAEGFKVIMTGEGADELLAGYHWFDGDRRVRPLLRLPRPLRALLARAPGRVSPAGRRVLAHGARDAAQRYALWQQVADAAHTRALLAFTPAHTILNGAADARHPLDQFLALDAQTRMVDFINFEVDRMSMANSVEARPPFLDHVLWEFCAQLPPDLKLNASGNKLLLRRAMRGQLPDRLLQQPKRGLATPHADWWRAARLPDWAEACIAPAALTGAGYFDPKALRQLRGQHRSGRGDHARLLMGVLTTQLWHRQFIA
ncbi:MAG: asparagine synthase (glutamine-hydrolyzing) [Anaerolineales bacterium]